MNRFKSTLRTVCPRATILIALAVLMSTAGCFRGKPSKDTPIHINPNMDDQPKYNPQAESKFFADGSAMREPVIGTVARGQLREDVVYYTGKDKNGNLVKKAPVAPTMEVLKRGQERFNIFCSPCHGKLGDGQGMVVKRGMFPPPTYHQERLRNVDDGHVFNVITYGIRNMPSYKSQIPVSDRWAIVNYFRALQHSQNAPRKDVPESYR